MHDVLTTMKKIQCSFAEGKEKSDERHLAFTAFADVDKHPRKRWLVQNFLGVGEMSAVYGMPGTAKSALAGDLGAHVAAGLPWFGRQVSQGAVLYIAAERGALVLRRMFAWRIQHGIDDIPLGIVAKSIDLRSDRKDADSVIACCDRLQKSFGHDPRLIIIDTLSRVLAGGDENAPRDMGLLVANLAYVQEGTGAHVLAIHHVPQGQLRLRGHGSLLGSMDTTVSLEKSRSGSVTATIDKNNDGPEGQTIAFRLEGVELCRDEGTGEITTAPVVVPIEVVPQQTSSKKKALSPKYERARRALAGLASGTLAKTPPDEWGLPAAINIVPSDAWRDALLRDGVLDKEDTNVRKRFWDLKNRLVAKNIIGERDGYVWIADLS
jgi:AAA domain